VYTSLLPSYASNLLLNQSVNGSYNLQKEQLGAGKQRWKIIKALTACTAMGRRSVVHGYDW